MIAKLKEQVDEFEKLNMWYLKDGAKQNFLFEMGIKNNESYYILYKPED